MKKRSAFVLVMLLCLIWVALLSNPTVKAEPKTIVVPDDYSTIQDAIDNAVAGDTVFVESGDYHENVRINKAISLVGENVDSTIIDGNPPEGFRIPVTIESDNVSVSGFKILYGHNGVGVGEVKFCSISGNRIAGGTHGIVLVSSSYCNVTKNYFELIGLSSAIQLSYANNNLVSGNYVTSCTEGIQIWLGSNNNTVTENTITACKNTAIGFQYSNDNILSRNDISYSGVGTSIYVSNNNTIFQNNYINNAKQFASDSNESYAMSWGYNVSVNIINSNYWSNYNGTDNNEDGIGDIPYIINDVNKDISPILEPVIVQIIPEFPSWTILPLLIVATLVGIIFRNKIRKNELE
jgi:parallel beta-helix repeat protein